MNEHPEQRIGVNLTLSLRQVHDETQIEITDASIGAVGGTVNVEDPYTHVAKLFRHVEYANYTSGLARKVGMLRELGLPYGMPALGTRWRVAISAWVPARVHTVVGNNFGPNGEPACVVLQNNTTGKDWKSPWRGIADWNERFVPVDARADASIGAVGGQPYNLDNTQQSASRLYRPRMPPLTVTTDSLPTIGSRWRLRPEAYFGIPDGNHTYVVIKRNILRHEKPTIVLRRESDDGFVWAQTWHGAVTWNKKFEPGDIYHAALRAVDPVREKTLRELAPAVGSEWIRKDGSAFAFRIVLVKRSLSTDHIVLGSQMATGPLAAIKMRKRFRYNRADLLKFYEKYKPYVKPASESIDEIRQQFREPHPLTPAIQSTWVSNADGKEYRVTSVSESGDVLLCDIGHERVPFHIKREMVYRWHDMFTLAKHSFNVPFTPSIESLWVSKRSGNCYRVLETNPGLGNVRLKRANDGKTFWWKAYRGENLFLFADTFTRAEF